MLPLEKRKQREKNNWWKFLSKKCYYLSNLYLNNVFLFIYFSFYLSVLLKYIGELGANFEVYRNDELTVEELKM